MCMCVCVFQVKNRLANASQLIRAFDYTPSITTCAITINIIGHAEPFVRIIYEERGVRVTAELTTISDNYDN